MLTEEMRVSGWIGERDFIATASADVALIPVIWRTRHEPAITVQRTGGTRIASAAQEYRANLCANYDARDLSAELDYKPGFRIIPTRWIISRTSV